MQKLFIIASIHLKSLKFNKTYKAMLSWVENVFLSYFNADLIIL